MPKRKPIMEPMIDEQLAALDVLIRAALATQVYQQTRDPRGLVRKELRERLRDVIHGRERVGLVLLKLASFALHGDETRRHLVVRPRIESVALQWIQAKIWRLL